MMTVNKLTLKELTMINHMLCKQQHKPQGVRHPSLLKAALLRPLSTYQGIELYPDLPSKAAALAELIIKGKPFASANTSTGFTAGLRLMEKNDFHIPADLEPWTSIRKIIADPDFHIDQLASCYRNCTAKALQS